MLGSGLVGLAAVGIVGNALRLRARVGRLAVLGDGPAIDGGRAASELRARLAVPWVRYEDRTASRARTTS